MFRHSSRLVRLLLACLVIAPTIAVAQGNGPEEVRVVKDTTGQRLQVAGRDFMVLGMNWDYFPIGTNYNYSLWVQPEDMIKQALDYEMALLKHMGVNTLRLYNGVPPKWVEYIWREYGIYSVINHPMLRYGYNIDGTWIPAEKIDYSDQRLRDAVTKEITDIVEEFRGVEGVLFFMLGNENNYQLTWRSTEIEALPEEQRDYARARHLYTLFNDVTLAMKETDPTRLVALCNGDLGYIDLIEEECGDVDIFATNVYRGISARDLYEVVAAKLDKPIVYAEFGSDAYNARDMREDQVMQAHYLIGQWQEIYEQSAGKGLVGNCIGGMTFQWNDGWWKYRQTENLSVHDTHASWPNGGYYDYVEGQFNMNEEWWGIMAKGYPDSRGLFELYPRAAYYALMQAYELDPYAPTTDLGAIRAHFSEISAVATALKARGDTAARQNEITSKVRVKGLRAEFETFTTGGENTVVPDVNDEFVLFYEDPETGARVFRDRRRFDQFYGFDHMESYFIDVEAQPAGGVRGEVSVNILGNVARNPIDQIFYENRGIFGPQVRTVSDNPFQLFFPPDSLEVDLPRLDRVRIYRASLNWEHEWFDLFSFYRQGKFHWGYEGDFFGFYPEAFYGENIDIYNGEAPVGVELEAKKGLQGLKVAFGPELWWGANPAYVLKYRRQMGRFNNTVMYHEDFAERAADVVTSSAIPQRLNRRASLSTETYLGPFGVEAGVLWSGNPEVGEEFQVVERGDSGRFEFYEDEVDHLDTFGGKLKLTWQKGRINWYGEGVVQGLVARSGINPRQNYTGWGLRDTGDGNVRGVLTGATYQIGDWQVGPNILWQKPFVDPIPREILLTEEREEPVFQDGVLALYGTGITPRTIVSAPFQVRGNRETFGTEVVLVYDPTPATWWWQWDNDVQEDADFAASLRFTHRHQPTTTDASVFIGRLGDLLEFGGAPPAKDIWELHFRAVSRLSPTSRLVFNAIGGPAQPTGSAFDTSEDAAQINRTIKRFHADARYINSRMSVIGAVKVNDWGPYDYHRDFNLTYPLQLMGDVGLTLGMPRWFYDAPQTRAGVRVTYRTLNEFSDKYFPMDVDLTSDEDPQGHEWEIRTYIHLAI